MTGADIVMGGITDVVGAAQAAFERRNNQDLQFLYFLASARTSFDRAGVRYRIVCNT